MNLNALTSRYGLVIGLVALVALFTVLRPEIFPTLSNFGSIMSDNAVLTLVALGIMVPLVVGQFDLSPGFVASFAVMLTAGLLAEQQLHPVIVLIAVLGVGVLIGAFMGVLIGYLHLNSLIVSLGIGSLVAGLVLLYSGGQIIFQGIPRGFLAAGQTRLFGFVPLPFLYAMGIAAAMWFVLSHRPVGRRLYAAGANPDAAQLIGVDVPRNILFAFIFSSAMACLAGYVQVARLGAGHPTSAQAFLLPAFAAAFLGATSFRPGFYNVWGTVFAVYLVGIGTTGLFMLGAESYVQPMFNGAVLILAVVAARLGVIRRERRSVEAAKASMRAETDEPKTGPAPVARTEAS